MEAIIHAIRAIREERIQRASWMECMLMARAFRDANEPPVGHIYGFLEYLIHQEIQLIDTNRRRRRREFRLHQRLQAGVPMDVDEWEEETSSGLGDEASTTDEESEVEGAGEEDVNDDDDADVVMEGEVDRPAESPATDYIESSESEYEEESDVEVIVEDEQGDAEAERRYEPLTPPPEDMWGLEDIEIEE